jgi:proteic killer suppression protein
VIETFGNRVAEALFFDRPSKCVKGSRRMFGGRQRRKLLYLHDAADLADLRVPPGNTLDRLKRRLVGYYSIRINDQWRIVFRRQSGQAFDVSVMDYH